MNLRQTRRALRTGALVLEQNGEIKAKSEFQRKRLTEALSMAKIYLEGTTVVELGEALGVTSERVAQVVRLGINYMTEAGWLRPVRGAARSLPRRS